MKIQTKNQNNKNVALKEKFNKIVSEKIHREGVENLMKYLEKDTDFYEAPASTRFHLCYIGGLIEHSLNVYENLVKLIDFYKKEYELDIHISEESIAIVALFHDLCKINKYEIQLRNKKDPDTGQWEQVSVYTIKEDTYEVGHGASSAFMLQKYIDLTAEEIQAIYWHMGAFDMSTYSGANALSKAFNGNVLAFALHIADMTSSYISENDFLQTFYKKL